MAADLIRRSPFIVVGNGSYVLSGFASEQRDHISDHQLSLYVAPRAGPARRVVAAVSRAVRNARAVRAVRNVLRAKEITIALRHRRVAGRHRRRGPRARIAAAVYGQAGARCEVPIALPA